MSPEEIIDRTLERYERPLISYAKTITGELESARDAVQDTFLRLSRQDVRALEPRMAPWLFFVCRNCALDHVRKVARFSDEALDEEQASEERTPAGEAMAADEAARLRGMLTYLSPRQQEVVKLKFEGGLSYKEIGETLKISVSHVGVELHEAIQTLRRLWGRENAGAAS